MIKLDEMRHILMCLGHGVKWDCGSCTLRVGCSKEWALGEALRWLNIVTEERVFGAMVIPREEYKNLDRDVWVEDMETGKVTAIDRSMIPALLRYMKLDADTPRRLWTARPTEEQRRGEGWKG